MRSGDGQNDGVKRNILNNAAYSIFRNESSSSTKNASRPVAHNNYGLPSSVVGNRRVTTTTNNSSSSSSYLQRSTSADNVQIVRQRGFKPSDRHDPAKRNFLESLTSKILHFDMESGHSTPIDLQKLLTPATDSNETLHVRNKKMYASSYFYAPTHPTMEDQVALARRISSSLSDVKNVKSKGQSMYVNRKKRSVKWIHDGNGQEDEEDTASPINKDKIPMKCMMNPSGKVLDYHGIQALGEDPNIPQVPPHPERLYDIVRDLNNQKGRGAEIFAKRRKRSEKWVVDAEPPQSPSIYGYGKAPTYPIKQDIGVNENLKFDNKPFYNPFDLSMDYNPPLPNCGHQCSRASFSSAHSDCGPCGHEVKKIYLREIAVGTEPEKLLRRGSFDGSRQPTYNPTRGCNMNNGNGYGRPSRNKNNHQNGGGHYNHHHNHHHNGRGNGYHNHMQNGYNYLNGHPPLENHHSGYGGYSNRGGYQNGGGGYGGGYPYPNGGAYQNGAGYPNGNGYSNGMGYQNGNGYSNGGGYQNGTNGYQNRNEYQNSSACQHPSDYQNGNGYPSPPANDNCEGDENPVEDYTPVPVKKLIQEFEKTCRPVMQFKQYPPRGAPMGNINQNDLSRYFESRREVVYRRPEDQQQQQQQRNQYRNGNGYASSGGDDEEDEDDDDDDDDGSLDDSLSPVDFYRVDDRRLQQTNNNSAPANNRSSSMTTLDDYYRQQLQQYHEDKSTKFVNSEADVPPGVKAANLAVAVTQDEITAQRKDLRKTPVLENLVAGTTTPECFKDKFTEDIATKLNDNAYHGPKIASYQNLTNYNTAPRGWDQSQSVYKPVRFEKPQDTKISYSDF